MDYPWRFKHISTAVTERCATAPCTLISVLINTGAAGALLDIFDGPDTNAQLVGTIDCSAVNQLFYGCAMETGLTVRQRVATADLTIVYLEAHMGWIPSGDVGQ